MIFGSGVNKISVVAAIPTPSVTILLPKVPRPLCVLTFANSVSKVWLINTPSTWSSTTICSKNSYLSLVVSWSWIKQYDESYLSTSCEMWLGYWPITFSVGDPDEEIWVILDSSLACFISTVDIPEDEVDSPTTIVLTTEVVPIPTSGWKSTLRLFPSRYAL